MFIQEFQQTCVNFPQISLSYKIILDPVCKCLCGCKRGTSGHATIIHITQYVYYPPTPTYPKYIQITSILQ